MMTVTRTLPAFARLALILVIPIVIVLVLVVTAMREFVPKENHAALHVSPHGKRVINSSQCGTLHPIMPPPNPLVRCYAKLVEGNAVICNRNLV